MTEQKDVIPNSKKKPVWQSLAGWIILIIVLSVLFSMLRDVKVNRILEERETKISEVVLKSIKFHVENDIVIPETFIISFDTITKSEINDSLVSYLKNVLFDKYIETDSIVNDNIITTPYFLFPTNKEEDGTYRLTDKQLSELKQNIIFLTNQVDKAVHETENEISESIDKLNMWVSIWIGIIGFLGIFIPILINYQTSKNISEALKNSSAAKEDASQAKGNAQEALSKSEDAIKNSKSIDNLLITTNSISKLKNIDSSRLIHVTDKKGHLVKILESVHKSMKACADSFNHNIVVDSFQELIISLYSISKFDFIDHTSIENITKFIISANGSLEEEWTIEKFKSNMTTLEDLISNLKD